jgi:hypothetical protein
VTVLDDRRIYEGHFTRIGNPNYKRAIPSNKPEASRDMNKELADNFELSAACAKVGLTDLLT